MPAKLLQLYPTLWNPMEPTRLLCPLDSPGRTTRMGCHALLQEIFPTQRSNLGLLCLLHWLLLLLLLLSRFSSVGLCATP